MPIGSWNALIEPLAADIQNRKYRSTRQVLFDVVRYFGASRTSTSWEAAWSGFPNWLTQSLSAHFLPLGVCSVWVYPVTESTDKSRANKTLDGHYENGILVGYGFTVPNRTQEQYPRAISISCRYRPKMFMLLPPSSTKSGAQLMSMTRRIGSHRI